MLFSDLIELGLHGCIKLHYTERLVEHRFHELDLFDIVAEVRIWGLVG